MVEHTAVGLNMIDTYYRRGIYPAALPVGLGVEAAGRVIAVGEGVTSLAVGDRVASFGPELGAYATARIYKAASLFKLPDAISDQTAAAAILKACTVEFLVERCAHVQAGMPVLVHAAAGGVEVEHDGPGAAALDEANAEGRVIGEPRKQLRLIGRQGLEARPFFGGDLLPAPHGHNGPPKPGIEPGPIERGLRAGRRRR
jgi:hypothetical protein